MSIAPCNVLSDHPAVCSSRAFGSLVLGVIPVHSCRNYDWSPVRLSVCLCYILVRYTSVDSNGLNWLGVPAT